MNAEAAAKLRRQAVEDRFLAALAEAQAEGLVSEVVCAAHDSIPTSVAEDEAADEDWDWCMHVIRLWSCT